jgi:hypothetical protein
VRSKVFPGNILLIVHTFEFLSAARRYAALLLLLLKSLEFVLMSSGLMAATCISTPLASKFEIATTINSPHVARVETA